MTRDRRESEGKDKLKELGARLRAANRARAKAGGRIDPSERRRRVNYRRRLKEARRRWEEGDRGTSFLLLEALDKDYPSVQSILGRPAGGGAFGGGAFGGGAASGGDWGDGGGGDGGGGGS